MGIVSLVEAATGRPEILRQLTSDRFNIWLGIFGEIKEMINDVDDSELVLYVYY
jgi:hypothetical protein